MASGELGLSTVHPSSESLHRHKSKTACSRSSGSSRTSDALRDRTSKASLTSSGGGESTSRSARPALSSRTHSSSTIPSGRGPEVVQPIRSTVPASQRDSVQSIKDDPFFKNYQTPQSLSLSRELTSASLSSSANDDDLMEEEAAWTSKKNIVPMAGKMKPTSRAGLENINIAVIGAAGVGKSTLIQRALGLRSLPTSAASSLKMSVDQVIYTVTMVELDLESFDFNPDRRIQWPKQINGQIVPRMDGALILYDVMNRESIIDLPQTLNSLVNSGLPTILVSCKCDNPVNTRQIDTESIQAACLAEVESVKTAANVPESARLCLGAMLRAVMASRQAAGIDTSATPRRKSSAVAGPGDNGESPSPTQQGNPNHPGSDDLIRKYSNASIGRSGSIPSQQIPAGRHNIQYQYNVGPGNTAPPLSLHPAFKDDPHGDLSDDLNEDFPSESGDQTGTTVRRTDSFLDMESSDADSSYRYSDDIPILQRTDDGFSDRPAKVVGFTFDELVDRLLNQQMSKADNNFIDIFLCLYRKFAAPAELFSAILGRLERVARDESSPYLSRTATQLRIINIVAKWVANYPGDFASPQTSRRLDAFIDQLFKEPAFAAAAQEMRSVLQQNVVEDDDTGWARTDADVKGDSDHVNTFLMTASVRSEVKPSAEFTKHIEDSPPTPSAVLEERDRNRRASEARSLSSGDAGSTYDTPLNVYQSVEDYEAEAATMIPMSTLPLTKFRYHICMDTSDEDFADEVTRIDWIMFSSIRVRDLVRHVSLPLEQKERCKSLVNVNRMISHFNHVARWVANMILMRDKAKHRALMLEKFMRIALRLRQLNNYNGLAAVIAGINGSAVHRLTQTRALVPVECQKRFMRLELLMSTQKSHFAYRLAWENSSLPRIPFMPLHRRDLVSAEEGSRTFVGPGGDRINWKKFEVLAEVLLPIMRSQGTPYPNLEKHDIARELILECRMPTDEEEIYQRSLQLESSSTVSSITHPPDPTGKKKFPWFQK